MKQKLGKIWVVLIILFVLCMCLFFNMHKPRKCFIEAKEGRMNLLDWEFEKNRIVHLDGQWELYFNQLLEPDDLKNIKTEKYFYIPEKLETQLDGKTTGYMTLHLKVLVPDNVVYGIRIESMLTASKLWINGVYQGGHGRVGKNIEEERAVYLPVYGYFTPIDGVVDIVIQTSSYREIHPIIRAIDFGLKKQIMDIYTINVAVDAVIIGGLLIIQLTYLAIYFLRRKEKSFLHFSILCFLIQLRCLILNERILVHIYPNMPYELLSKMAAITYYLWIWVYVLFLKDKFKDFSNKIIYLSGGFGVIFTAICLATDSIIYDRLGIFSEILLFFILVYILRFLMKKSRVKDRKGNISLFAFLILIITATNDILVNNRISDNIYIFQIGMLVFAFLESYMLAINFSFGFNRLEELSIENQNIYEKSIRDSLTNLYNHKYIEQKLIDAIKRFREKKETFTVIMIDIDYFKAVNDRYGHPFGDEVLVALSNLLMKSLRATDLVGRYGGEEFLIILPNTEIVEARKIAHRIRKNVENLSWECKKSNITISVGLYENEVYTKKECMKLVDELLYLAKKNGRNRVEESFENMG